MCFVVNKFLHLFQVLRNFQNTATAINAPPSPLVKMPNRNDKQNSTAKSRARKLYDNLLTKHNGCHQNAK